MKLIYNPLGFSMNIQKNNSNILVIENHEEFEKFLLRLNEQTKGDVDYFYTDEEKMTLFHRISIITSPFDLKIAEREIQKKLYNHLIDELDSTDLLENLNEAHSAIIKVMEELSLICDYEIDYDECFSLNSLLKNINVRLKLLDGNFCEKLISFGEISYKLLAKDFIVLYNCDAYLQSEDYYNLNKWANYNEITLLFIRNNQFIYPKECNEYIIDKDLCEIH